MILSSGQNELIVGESHPVLEIANETQNSLVRQWRALSRCWPGEEKPLAARLSGVEVSLLSAIKCLPLSSMNHRITGETVHCCLKASLPLIHVFPSCHHCSPLPALAINPDSAPSHSSFRYYVCVSVSLPFFVASYLPMLLLSHYVCPLLE